MSSKIEKIKSLKKAKLYFKTGKSLLTNEVYLQGKETSRREQEKEPSRTTIINYLISTIGKKRETNYLEIGVRNPEKNFNHITATNKYGVDPGIEFEKNPVDFKMTSDEFFSALSSGQALSTSIQFDVIFIDGLHLADQADRDITNSLKYIKDDGFIVLHDCNPPTEWHARDDFNYSLTPAHMFWNGTTWKAFLKWRQIASVNSCCIDSDWGVGIISKSRPIGKAIPNTNPFYEYYNLKANRKDQLNLISFKQLQKCLN